MTAPGYTFPVSRREKDPPTPQGKWIRAVRKSVGLTQPEFAAKIRTDRVTVSKWENGTYVPEWASLEKVMRAFPEAPPPPLPTNGHVAPGRQPHRATASSLLGVVDEWARDVGDLDLQHDAEFARGLLTLYEEHRKRFAGRSTSPKSD